MSPEPWTLVGHFASVRYHVVADASPGLLPRLLHPFARRDLMPDAVESRHLDGTMRVEIAMAAMPAEMVHLVAGNLAQVVGVRSLTHRQEVIGQVQRRAA
jgi:hypothetical protein